MNIVNAELYKSLHTGFIDRDFNSKVSSSGYRNGSIYGTIHNQALIEITNNRTAELSKMFLYLTTK